LTSSRFTLLLFFEYATLNGGEFSLLAMLRELLSEASDSPFRFVAALPADGPLNDQLQELGVESVSLELRDEQDRKLPPELINAGLQRIVARFRPDLVHANSLSMGRMLGRVAGELSVPCTAHLRDIVKLSRKAVEDLNQNSGMIAVSDETKSFHVAQGFDETQIDVIHNGIDLEQFKPRPQTGKLKRELGLPEDSFLIANIGQICLRKGQQLLAKGAVSLAEVFPEIHYLYLGERHSQKQESVEYEEGIKEIFQDAGMEDRLLMPGFRDDVAFVLNEVDLLVHTANQEPLGRVLLEGAASGTPIIATDVGGTAEILKDRESAWLIPKADLDQLVHSIKELKLNSTLRDRLGMAARKRAVDQFDLEQVAGKIERFWLDRLC